MNTMNEIEFVKKLNKYNKIFLYGAGMVGQLVLERLLFYGITSSKICFVVSDPKENQKFLGYNVYGVEEILACNTSSISVVATLKNNHEQIVNNLIKHNIDEYIVIEEDLHDEMDKNYIKEFLKKNDDMQYGTKDVLFMSSDNNYSSGAFLCMLDICREMITNNIRPLVVLPRHGNGEKILEENDIDYTYVFSRNWLVPNDETTIKLEENIEAYDRIKDLIKKHNIKVVHNNSNHTYVGALVAKEIGIPYIWHIRENVYEQGFRFFDQEFADDLINKADYIIAVSKYVGSCYKNLDRNKIRIISDGVDGARYFCNHSILKQNKVHIFMPGIMVPLKGQHQLIVAADKLKDKGYNFEVSFVGSGEADYIQKIYNMISKYSLEEYIKIYDRVDNIEKWYKKNDITVVCSRSEAFGRVTVEAMMAGCLVVGARCGATPELIEDGKEGYLYELDNVEELAKVLEKAIDNIDVSRRIAKTGQEHALDTFDRNITSKRVIDLYRNELH